MMREYLDLCKRVFNEGEMCPTGAKVNGEFIDALSIYGVHFESEKFPLLTTKKMPFKMIQQELIWFLRGSTDIESLGNSIWDEWGPELGPIYGVQWRNFGGVDQIEQLMDNIQKVKRDCRDRNRRRLIVSAWNPPELEFMALEPCHMIWQIGMIEDTLHLGMMQRSCDAFLGVPFNIASYALLLRVIAKFTGMKVGRVNILFGDFHIYENHLNVMREQIKREPFESCNVEIKGNNIYDWEAKLIGYQCHGGLSGSVAI